MVMAEMKNSVDLFVAGSSVQYIPKYNKVEFLDHQMNYLVLSTNSRIGLFKRNAEESCWAISAERALNGRLKVINQRLFLISDSSAKVSEISLPK